MMVTILRDLATRGLPAAPHPTAHTQPGRYADRLQLQRLPSLSYLRYATRLLLGSGGLLLLLLLASKASTLVAVLGPLLTEGTEGLELLLLGSDGAGRLDGDASGDGEGSSSVTNGLDRGEVDLLVLVLLVATGEDHETAVVGLDALGVELERLLRLVAAAVVDGDADGLGLLLAQARSLDLLGGEALALTAASGVSDANERRWGQRYSLRGGERLAHAQLGVVLERGASDSRAEGLDGAEAESGGLGLASVAARLLGAGLVEPDLDATLPVLAEVVVVKDVVVAETHCAASEGGDGGQLGVPTVEVTAASKGQRMRSAASGCDDDDDRSDGCEDDGCDDEQYARVWQQHTLCPSQRGIPSRHTRPPSNLQFAMPRLLQHWAETTRWQQLQRLTQRCTSTSSLPSYDGRRVCLSLQLAHAPSTSPPLPFACHRRRRRCSIHDSAAQRLPSMMLL